MQMTKTSAALHLLTEKRLPFISRIDRPDHGRRICQLCLLGRCGFGRTECSDWFAGPRVIEQTVRETLPEGFQRAEFLLEKGAIDQIVDRRSMKKRISDLITLLRHEGKVTAA